MKLIQLMMMLAVCCRAEAVRTPFWSGMASTGLHPVQIALGGVRSLPLPGPSGLLANPSSLSMQPGTETVHLSGDIVFVEESFNDASGPREGSAVSLPGSFSAGFSRRSSATGAYGILVSRVMNDHGRVVYGDWNSSGNLDEIFTGSSVYDARAGFSLKASDRLAVGGVTGVRHVEYTGSVDYGEPRESVSGYTIRLESFPVFFGTGITLIGEEGTAGLSMITVYGEETLVAAGAKKGLTESVTAGTEVELCAWQGEILWTGRLFTTYRATPSLTLMGSVFHSTRHSIESRQGTGYSGGVSWETGPVIVSASFARFPMYGFGIYPAFADVESFKGSQSVLTAGIAFTGRQRTPQEPHEGRNGP
jgi:hypothetical protein